MQCFSVLMKVAICLPQTFVGGESLAQTFAGAESLFRAKTLWLIWYDLNMPQKHPVQEGIFNITTNAYQHSPWFTLDGIPKILIDNLCMTRNVHGGQLIDFNILPDHIHFILEAGQRGLSAFVQSFKRNASKDVKIFLGKSPNLAFTGWQEGFHDERIWDEDQLRAAQRYVQENAMRHHLVEEPEDWPWTSLHFEHLLGCRKQQEVRWKREQRERVHRGE